MKAPQRILLEILPDERGREREIERERERERERNDKRYRLKKRQHHRGGRIVTLSFR